MITVEEIRELDRLRSLEAQWNGLVESSAGAEIYRTLAWTSAWWGTHGDGDKQLAVLVVNDGPQLLAVAPLMRVRRSLLGLPVRSVEFISMWKYPGSAASCLGSMDIACGNRVDESVEAILRYLEGNDPPWDVVRLHPIPGDSPTIPAMKAAAAHRHFRFVDRSAGTNAYVDRKESGEPYSAELSRKLRERLAQAERKLLRLGTVDYSCCESEANVPRAYNEMMDIEQSSWKWTRGIPLNSTVFRDFYRTLAREAALRGWLRMWFLRLDGRSIAYAYCVDVAGNAELLKIGYDKQYSACSPGSLLIRHAFDEMFRSGAKRINMLGGDMEYKQRWLTRPGRLNEIFVFRGSGYGIFLRLLYFRFGLYGRFRFFDISVKRIARKLGIAIAQSELTRMDQLRRHS